MKLPHTTLETLSKYPQIKAVANLLPDGEDAQKAYIDIVELIRQLDFKVNGGREF